MKAFRFVFALILLSLASSIVSAYDATPLQDLCVAVGEPKAAVIVNGKFCKDPKESKANDFFFSGLNIPRNTRNQDGSNVTLVTVDQIPGLNTLGTSIARIDYAPDGGLNPPHTHPRGTEVLLVLEGTLYVGFVTSNPNHTLFTKVLKPGDVFVFPIGLIHFQHNLAKSNVVAIAAFNSQNPGTITIATTVFGSHPPINPQVLIRGIPIEQRRGCQLQKKFGGTKN